MRKFLFLVILLILLAGFSGAVAAEDTEEFPLVWVSATDLLFAGAKSDTGYSNVFHLSYKYSSEWVLVSAKEAIMGDGTISYKDGSQHTFSQDGAHLGAMSFTDFLEAVDYASMERASLGTDGSILTPFTGPKIGFAVIQAKDGLLTQISLAREADEISGNLHLYEGFLYQFDEDIELKAQIAFSEISFSTQGLLRSSVEAPSLVETPQTSNGEIPKPIITPYETSSNPGLPGGPGTSENTYAPVYTPPEDYDVPPITKIGVVMFNDHSKHPDMVKVATEELTTQLGKIDGLEVSQMEFDRDVWGGGVLYDRAVELGKEYGVDAFIISDIVDFNLPKLTEQVGLVTEVQIRGQIDFSIIDTTGGRVFWTTSADSLNFFNYRDYVNNEQASARSALRDIIKTGLSNLITDNVLAGGPVSKDWGNES